MAVKTSGVHSQTALAQAISEVKKDLEIFREVTQSGGKGGSGKDKAETGEPHAAPARRAATG